MSAYRRRWGKKKKEEEQSVRSSRSALMEAPGRKQVWCCWKRTFNKGTRPQASILPGSEYLLVLGCAFFHHLPFIPSFMCRPLRVLARGGALLWQPSDWLMHWSGPWIEIETSTSLTSGWKLDAVAFNCRAVRAVRWCDWELAKGEPSCYHGLV